MRATDKSSTRLYVAEQPSPPLWIAKAGVFSGAPGSLAAAARNQGAGAGAKHRAMQAFGNKPKAPSQTSFAPGTPSKPSASPLIGGKMHAAGTKPPMPAAPAEIQGRGNYVPYNKGIQDDEEDAGGVGKSLWIAIIPPQRLYVRTR